jgi:hypothetical protein
MPTIAQIRRDFLRVSTGSRALFNFCLVPRGIHTDAGVEAAFLQLFKGWEGLLEEVFVAYMCSRLSHDGQSMDCHVRAPSDAVARALLYQKRLYIEWTNPEDVRDRARSYFVTPNRIEAAVTSAMGELRQMSVVRNAIAHSSPSSLKRLQELVMRKFGGKPLLSRPAEFLLRANPADSSRTIFDRYATVLEVCSQTITG